MSIWSPTHVQFTVLRARNLVAKGKGGNNDVFATIQLGKEKFQTSTIKNALNPEWFEECDLPIPHMHTAVEVSLFHRGMLSDDFLGYAAIPVWEHKVSDPPQSCWVTLRGKPSSKSGDKKYRGELEIKLAFHCHSRADVVGSGGKKRAPSIRNLASVFGDKLKFTRSRSFRENRRDPEGGKVDLSQIPSGQSKAELAEEGLTRSYSMSAAYVKAMNVDRGPQIINHSLMSNHNSSSGNNINNNNNAASTAEPSHYSPAPTPLYSPVVTPLCSQSVYSLPGNRRSCSELPPATTAPPPYFPPSTSVPASRAQDDSALAMNQRPRDRRSTLPGDRTWTMSDMSLGGVDTTVGSVAISGNTCSTNKTSAAQRSPPPPPPALPPPLPHHHHLNNSSNNNNHRLSLPPFFTPTSAAIPTSSNPQPHFPSGPSIYESIKERTEPENSWSSSSSTSSLENEDLPLSHSARTSRQLGQARRANVPVMGRDGLTAAAQHHHSQHVMGLHNHHLELLTQHHPHHYSRHTSITTPAIARPSSSLGFPSWSSNISRNPAPNHNNLASSINTNTTINSGLNHQEQQISTNGAQRRPRPNSFPSLALPSLNPVTFDSANKDHKRPLLEDHQQQLSSTLDSGIVDDRSSSLGANSMEGGSGLNTPDRLSALTTSATQTPTDFLSKSLPHSSASAAFTSVTTANGGSPIVSGQGQVNLMASDPIPGAVSSSSLLYHLDRELYVLGGTQEQQQQSHRRGASDKPGKSGHSLLLTGTNSGSGMGDAMVVRKRSRGERDRLRQMRQGNRRFTSAESSDLNLSSLREGRAQFESNDRINGLMAAYSNMSREELVRAVIQSKAQMIRKDQYIRDLESYIDDLLVRVMETTPPLAAGKQNLLRY